MTRRTWLIGGSNLTPEQLDVARAHPGEHMLVTGPAGSGKTLLLLHRADHIMREHKFAPSRMGVMVAPGATQLAVMFWSASSSVRLRVKERMAPLAAV